MTNEYEPSDDDQEADDFDLPAELADILSGQADRPEYSVEQKLDQYRHALKIVAGRQSLINRKVNRLLRLERDRTLFVRIVLWCGSGVAFVLMLGSTFFAGWWNRK